MPVLPLFCVLAAAPVTAPWSARIENDLLKDLASKVTVYAAGDQPFDSAPCLSDKALNLIDGACRDSRSVRALIAAAKKSGPAKVVASATPDAEGRFTVQVPAGRLFVHVQSQRWAHDFVVEPVAGVETQLKGRNDYQRSDLEVELRELLNEWELPADFKDVWVIGQDNPQIVHLVAKDVKALLARKYQGPLLWGCSRVVSGTGAALGTTCDADKRHRVGSGPLASFEVNGRVTGPDGAPRAGVSVRLFADVVETVKSAIDGRFSADIVTTAPSVLVVAEDGELNASALAPVVHRFSEASPAQTVALRLGEKEFFRARLKTPSGALAVGASVRLQHDHNLLLDEESDAQGEFIVPRALQRAWFRVHLPHHRSLLRRVDLAKETEFTLEAAVTREVEFRWADGLLIHQPEVERDACLEVSQNPSRSGRVRLELQQESIALAPARGLESVIVSRDGVYTLPRPEKPRELPFAIDAPDGAFISWSTKTDLPEPGLQFARACFRGDCVVEAIEVKAGGAVALKPPLSTRLEITTRGYLAGAKMPRVSIYGPNIEEGKQGFFDQDGVCRVKVPPGPWLVTAKEDFRTLVSKWCNAGQRCELDLAASKKDRHVNLRGDVPAEVSFSDGSTFSFDPTRPVVDGGLELEDGWAVIENTSAVPPGVSEVTVTLAPPTTVQVHVVDPQGQPVRDAVVSWGRPSAGSWTSTNAALTDSEGRVSFENLRPGNLPLRISKAGFALTETRDTAVKNEVKLAPGYDVTCVSPALKPTSWARCLVTLGQNTTLETSTVIAPMTLTDLPGMPLKFELVVSDTQTKETWVLSTLSDPSRAREISFEPPRSGVRLVLPFEQASVLVPKLGEASCHQLGSGAFCETPPLPPGEVTISGRIPHGHEMKWKFQVPTQGARVLVPFPSVMP
jgi:Carboxypeptidase regulatory-like domain